MFALPRSLNSSSGRAVLVEKGATTEDGDFVEDVMDEAGEHIVEVLEVEIIPMEGSYEEINEFNRIGIVLVCAHHLQDMFKNSEIKVVY